MDTSGVRDRLNYRSRRGPRPFKRSSLIASCSFLTGYGVFSCCVVLASEGRTTIPENGATHVSRSTICFTRCCRAAVCGQRCAPANGCQASEPEAMACARFIIPGLRMPPHAECHSWKIDALIVIKTASHCDRWQLYGFLSHGRKRLCLHEEDVRQRAAGHALAHEAVDALSASDASLRGPIFRRFDLPQSPFRRALAT